MGDHPMKHRHQQSRAIASGALLVRAVPHTVVVLAQTTLAQRLLLELNWWVNGNPCQPRTPLAHAGTMWSVESPYIFDHFGNKMFDHWEPSPTVPNFSSCGFDWLIKLDLASWMVIPQSMLGHYFAAGAHPQA